MTNGKKGGALVAASTQAEMPLIARKVENRLVHQRAIDGYFNATAMCQAAGKRFGGYHRLTSTTDFLNALEADVQISTSELVQSIKGGVPELQGTWVHPYVAINLAMWLSPVFAVQVSKWVAEWLSGRAAHPASLPDHVRRYLVNQNKIPGTHFSMLNQMIFRLLAPLESHGYILPDRFMPDISLGKMFSGWLRENGHDPDSFPSYRHEFVDNRRTVDARLYPNEVMTEFNVQLDNWLRGKAREYFGKRDEAAILPLDRVLTDLPAPAINRELTDEAQS